jgi:hypothetical protein
MGTHPQKPTIVITGGNFVNKGAESMLMSTVNAIRTHFPGYEPVLLDLFPTVKPSDKDKFSFRIVNMHVRSLFYNIRKLFLSGSLLDLKRSANLE